LLPSGELDRAALARIVFAEPAELASLEAIMHPRIAARSAEIEAAAIAAGTPVVVHDVPLLVERGQWRRFDAVVVVRAEVSLRLDRLVARGVERADALARMERQASDEQRAEVADFVIDNSGDLDALAAEVELVWSALSDQDRAH
jgi:dephospho-CoA kinase